LSQKRYQGEECSDELGSCWALPKIRLSRGTGAKSRKSGGRGLSTLPKGRTYLRLILNHRGHRDKERNKNEDC